MQPQRNWRDLLKPQSLESEEKNLSSTYGKFVGEPFERGFGTTIGNAIRRVLLSSLQGAARSEKLPPSAPDGTVRLRIADLQQQLSAGRGLLLQQQTWS